MEWEKIPAIPRGIKRPLRRFFLSNICYFFVCSKERQRYIFISEQLTFPVAPRFHLKLFLLSGDKCIHHARSYPHNHRCRPSRSVRSGSPPYSQMDDWFSYVCVLL